MWWIKQCALICVMVVMMAAWNVPKLNTAEFWIGVFAFAIYGAIENGWKLK